MTEISMTLTPRSIEKAIREIKDYRRKLNNRINTLIEVLVGLGVEIAKAEVRSLGAVYTGELEESITGLFDPRLAAGIIKTDCPYAVYVEYGTGIVGKGSPHPAPKGWKYDVNEHGESGWFYYNERDQKWHWTQGMESRSFMYNTRQILEQNVVKTAKEVFASG